MRDVDRLEPWILHTVEQALTTAQQDGDDVERERLERVPACLRIVATLAALNDGDTLSFTRLQDMIGLTPGNLIVHLRKLEDADYVSSQKTGNGLRPGPPGH